MLYKAQDAVISINPSFAINIFLQSLSFATNQHPFQVLQYLYLFTCTRVGHKIFTVTKTDISSSSGRSRSPRALRAPCAKNYITLSLHNLPTPILANVPKIIRPCPNSFITNNVQSCTSQFKLPNLPIYSTFIEHTSSSLLHPHHPRNAFRDLS